MKIIDSHMHCGNQNVRLPFETVQGYLREGGIDGACLFAPVEDIYNRYDDHFQDSQAWIDCRQKANKYVLNLQQSRTDVFAYYFVWNNFKKEELKKGYKGVKWHRHEDEPVYHYDDPLCEAFLQEIYDLQLPILLEESFENTCYLIKRVKGRTPVIIPHLGMLNGGFETLFRSGIWDDETIYADTALASSWEISRFLEKYGSGRLLFGSDFPFGSPGQELQKLTRLVIGSEDLENVVCWNFLRLIKAIPQHDPPARRGIFALSMMDS
jgi:predicted TIM-barrel fold metal-dependent hydrolase